MKSFKYRKVLEKNMHQLCMYHFVHMGINKNTNALRE